MEKSTNISISMNSKIIAATALGAGIIVGASTAYILTRIHEHSNITHLVSHLHKTIQEVKEEIAHLENELGLKHRVGESHTTGKSAKKRHRKTVSFSSTATSSSSYKTADQSIEESSFKSANERLTDTDSWKTSYANDTDYFSPEEDDEFFDVLHTEDEAEDYLRSIEVPCRDNISDDVSDLAQLLRVVDRLIDSSTEEQKQAYELLLNKGQKYRNNAEILWRLAKATYNMAAIEEISGNLKEKEFLINEAYSDAEEALKINDQSVEVHKWFAILAGARGDFLSTKERIASGHVFKKHIDIAIKINPNDSTLHHLLGRFCYEISLLTWVERKVASTLFGDVPFLTFGEALNHFLSAEDLKPTGWKENRLFIAKCCFKLGDAEGGEKWLKQALGVPPLTASDECLDREIHKLFNQHSIVL